MPNKPRIDLHFHSTYSDGKQTVQELAQLIKKAGLKYCALTDHDTVAGINELKKYLAGSAVTVIPGVELTALNKNNIIHILAYDFEVKAVAKVLKKRNELVRQQKIKEMQKAITLYKKAGFKISKDLKPSDKKPVGYTLAVDICQQKFNQELFFKKHHKNLTPDNLYLAYGAPGKACAVKKSGVSVHWLLSRLKGIVGDLIISHPFLAVSIVNKPLTKKDILSLIKLGLSGVEMYHEKNSTANTVWLKKLVKDKKLHYSGGSDSHGDKNGLELGTCGSKTPITNFKLTNYELTENAS